MRTVHRAPGDTLEECLARLSPRQFEILRLAAGGNSTAQIAAILGMSRNTARTQTQSILVRLGVHSRPQAVAVAVLYGMVAGNDWSQRAAAPRRFRFPSPRRLLADDSRGVRRAPPYHTSIRFLDPLHASGLGPIESTFTS
jgi:DNA-binding CsgD family transcriptional regulator